MGRFLAGSIATLLLMSAGLFWWQGRVDRSTQPLVALGGARAQAPGPEVPPEGNPNARGAPPPDVPGADPRTREQKRFERYDRNRDGIITRLEMMSTRSAAFRKLDKDGNNLLSFEEWAVATSDRFAGADVNHDGRLSPEEFARTAPPPRAPTRQPACACDEAD